ncbi:DUF397 domain-containing protein [Streptomyces sp. NPDC086549]|uniref:DUF397 domain-containing protein n=1 Tax=Streptomyces sp. NPDC086549 TaxID=3365752 RepID=UPI00380D268F
MTITVNWQKSSYSGGGDGNNCLELATSDNILLLRESDSPTTVLETSRPQLAALIGHLRQG